MSCLDTNMDMKVTVDQWLLANLNVSGFYRVKYDIANYNKLLKQLTTAHEVSGYNLESWIEPETV